MSHLKQNPKPPSSPPDETGLRTARFSDRRVSLDQCFALHRMKKAWKNYVRPGFRDQEITDLYDYFDYHQNVEERLSVLRRNVLEGSYRPRAPLPIKIEKKLGISRRTWLPSVEDAVILQTVSEALHNGIVAKQPTANAFYSRSHGFKPKNISIEKIEDYSWIEKWKVFSRQRSDLVSSHPFIAVADIASYFDCIDCRQLRNVLSSCLLADEVIYDLLFMALEGLAWRPDYAPLTGMGIPQVNFDAPRLLAHAYLFDVDRVLMNDCGGKFVRWVDDITIAVDSRAEGKKILGKLDEVLGARGLRLNTGKTKIMSADEAAEYFWVETNSAIDALVRDGGQIDTANTKAITEIATEFMKKPQTGQWEKIYKRLLSAFGNLGIADFCKNWATLIRDHPELRNSLFSYYNKLGYSPHRLNDLESFLMSTDIVDDASPFMAARTIVNWPIDSETFEQIVTLARKMAQRGDKYSMFLGGLWLVGKYGNADELAKFVTDNRNCWTRSSFMARQVAALAVRLGRREKLDL